MAQKTIDTNQLSDTELKALAYDLMVQGDNLNRNLQAINQVIAERAQARMAAGEAPIEAEPKKEVSPEPTL